MPELNFERYVEFSPKQMMALVADIKAYPQFVPYCSDMQVQDDDEEEGAKLALMLVEFGPISQSYTSRVIIDKNENTISATAIDGPFSHLDSVWQFVADGDGTLIRFDIDFGFSNSFIGKIAEPIFAQKQSEILDAFIAEAKNRYR